MGTTKAVPVVTIITTRDAPAITIIMRAAAAGNCFFFEIFTKAVEEYDTHGLRCFPDAECAETCDAHEEIFIQYMTVPEILPCSAQNFSGKYCVGGCKSNRGETETADALQHKSCSKQSSTQQDYVPIGISVTVPVFMMS